MRSRATRESGGNVIRFGIIGAGRIARTFATALQGRDIPIQAIASRSLDKAVAFQNEFSVNKAYGNYEDLYRDPDVDVVYVATPHGLHEEQMLSILDHEKAILCEKAFTLNENQARRVFRKAEEKGVFVMEAMWTRFLPVMKKLVKFVNDGMIGKIESVEANFCFDSKADLSDRLFAPELGGGALLDVGIYPITFAHLFLGMPDSIESDVTFGPTGVDIDETLIFHYPEAQARLRASISQDETRDGVIRGTKGHIRVENFWMADRAFIYNKDGELIREIALPHAVNGMEYEADEVVFCLEKHELQSSIMPHVLTTDILSLMDSIRKQWNFKYPGE